MKLLRAVKQDVYDVLKDLGIKEVTSSERRQIVGNWNLTLMPREEAVVLCIWDKLESDQVKF